MDVIDSDWKYYGLSVNGYQGFSTDHIVPIQFHVLAQHPLKESFEEMSHANASLRGLKYEVDEPIRKSSKVSRILWILLIVLMILLAIWNIYRGVLNPYSIEILSFVTNAFILLIVGGYFLFEKVIKDRKKPKNLFGENVFLSKNEIHFQTSKNKEDTLLELLQNLYLLHCLKKSQTIQKEWKERIKKEEDTNYLNWKNKVKTNKRNARKETNKS